MCRDERFILSKFKYSIIYYDIQNILFSILSTDKKNQIIKSYSDFKYYHIDWIKSMKNNQSLNLRAVSINFQY